MTERKRAIGTDLRKLDAQLRPVGFRKRFEGEQVNNFGRVVIQIADRVLVEVLAANPEFRQPRFKLRDRAICQK